MHLYKHIDMSKTISISDHVYKLLKREKGEKSFSEVIEELVEENEKLADVTGQKILDRETMEEVKKDIEKMSKGTIERIEDETT